MDRTDLKMHKTFCALAFGLALQTGWAGDVPAAARADAALRGAGLMHAGLVVAAQPQAASRGGEQAALKANLEGEAEASTKDETKPNHTTGMLLAALALMAGIVLRRWGSSQQ